MLRGPPRRSAHDPALTARLREADAAARGRRAARRHRDGRLHARSRRRGRGGRSIHVHPDPEELGRVYEPTLGDRLVWAALRGGARRGSRRSTARRRRRDAATRTFARTSTGGRCRARVDLTRRDGERFASGSGPTRSSPTAPATSPSGRIASTVPALPHAARAGARRDGLRPAGRDRRKARPSRPRRRLHRGRRRLPDERARARDRVQHDAPIVVLVVDNGMYGTIRMHQERHYRGASSGTDLVNPDFVALARVVRRLRRARRADARTFAGRARPRARRAARPLSCTCASIPRR